MNRLNVRDMSHAEMFAERKSIGAIKLRIRQEAKWRNGSMDGATLFKLRPFNERIDAIDAELDSGNN